jgi:hypothetical protein
LAKCFIVCIKKCIFYKNIFGVVCMSKLLAGFSTTAKVVSMIVLPTAMCKVAISMVVLPTAMCKVAISMIVLPTAMCKVAISMIVLPTAMVLLKIPIKLWITL